MGKHVIFLGAGASISSGYPLAKHLTLLMADGRTREDTLKHRLIDESDPVCIDDLLRMFRGFELEATIFLREGCFETMDSLGHFCAGRGRSNLIPNLKRLMRFCLSIHNPLEENFGTSDYIGFVQALLRKDPESPDKDVAILSFNYDPLLDYLLYLAVWQRGNLKDPSNPLRPESSLACSVTSGFSKPKNLEWLAEEGFCHLKLHGVIAPPPPRMNERRVRLPIEHGDTKPFNSYDLFGPSPTLHRLAALTREPFIKSEPPVVLPWEILDGSGSIRSREDFISAVGDAQFQLHLYYDLLRGVWERARREVQKAEKISFVGISMNPLLTPGLKFLLEGKQQPGVGLVVVNPDVARFKHRYHPRSATGKAAIALREILGESFATFKSDSEGGSDEGVREYFGKERRAGVEHEVTQYETFAKFIESELG